MLVFSLSLSSCIMFAIVISFEGILFTFGGDGCPLRSLRSLPRMSFLYLPHEPHVITYSRLNGHPNTSLTGAWRQLFLLNPSSHPLCHHGMYKIQCVGGTIHPSQVNLHVGLCVCQHLVMSSLLMKPCLLPVLPQVSYL